MKQRNLKAICGTCPYWRRDISDKGHCVRHSPIIEADGVFRAEFPWMFKSEVCGEHPDFFLEDTKGGQQ